MDRMFMERMSFVSMPWFNVDSSQKICGSLALSLTVKSPSEEIKDVLPRYPQEVTEVVDAVTWYGVVDGYRYGGCRQKESSSCPVTWY